VKIGAKGTWRGARREQLLRWRALPLEDKLVALVELRALSARMPEDQSSKGSDKGPEGGGAQGRLVK